METWQQERRRFMVRVQYRQRRYRQLAMTVFIVKFVLVPAGAWR